jgi:hypothetical protein
MIACRFSVFVLVASAPLALAGCEETIAPCPGCGPEICFNLAVDDARFTFTGRGGFWGEAVYVPVIPSPIPVDLPGENALALKIKAGTPPGTYALGEGANADIATCEQCLVFLQDVHADNPTAVWFPERGTLTLESTDTATGEHRGTLSGVVLRQAGRVGGLQYQGFVAGSQCVALKNAAFDTRAVEGRPCASSSDCPNNALQACDPRTGTCIASQCSAEKIPACPEPTDVCMTQDTTYDVGACYATCVPFTPDACPFGSLCVSMSYAGDLGVCKLEGPSLPATFDRCTPNDAGTGCGAGEVCATHAPFFHFDNCYPQCDYFGPEPVCMNGSCFLTFHNWVEATSAELCGFGDCHEGGMCLPLGSAPFTGDEAKVGEACAKDHTDWICGPDPSGQRRGICFNDGDEVRCRMPCRLGKSDCADGGVCKQYVIAEGKEGERAIDGIGICQ